MKSLPLLSVLLLTLTISPAFAGAGSSGGGNVCYQGEHPVLLELSDYDKAYTSEPGSPPNYNSEHEYGQKYLGYSFPYTAEERPDIMPKVYDRAKQILAANNFRSPFMVKLLNHIVDHFAFSFTEFNIEVPVNADFSESTLCSVNNTRASILFVGGEWAFIDLNQFVKLDLNSQAGLLIHEALRTVQNLLLEGTGNKAPMTDGALQNYVKSLFNVYLGISKTSDTIDSDQLFMAFAESKFFKFLYAGNLNVDRGSITNTIIDKLENYYEYSNDSIATSFVMESFQFINFESWSRQYRNDPQSISQTDRDNLNNWVRKLCNAKNNIKPYFKTGYGLVFSSGEMMKDLLKPNDACTGDLLPQYLGN